MTAKGSPPPVTNLRSAAEAALAGAPDRAADKLLYELQVHQVELEMQNEALRQARATLEESRDRYLDLYEFAPVGYLTLSADAEICAINLTGATLLGDQRQNLLHRRFAHFVVAADRARWEQYFRQAHDRGEHQICELRMQRSDHTVFAASLSGVLANSGDAVPELRLVITDISQRRQAEQALQESESRFRVMADSAPVLIWMAGIDKGCSWFNQQWLTFTGRSLAQELGQGWADSIHRDDLESCLRTYNEAFARREPFTMEYRLRRADGVYCWVIDRGVPRYGADREFLGYIGSCIDVTRLKQAEDDLNRAQGVGHIGSWRLDARSSEIVCSQEIHRIFGLPEGVPLRYETFLGQVLPDDIAYVDRMWQAGMRGAPYEIEHRLLVNGQVKWVREKAEFEFDAQGQLQGGFGITQDITEIKQAQQTLRNFAAEQAAHLRQLAGELTRAEQHERDRICELLHDAMQPLLVAARLSLSGVDARTAAAEFRRVAGEASLHISRVIDIAQTLSLQLSPPLIREHGLVPALESLCRWVKDNHRLAVEMESGPGTEPADMATRLHCFTAVREFLMNVVKHADTDRAKLTLQYVAPDSLQIVVADQGKGFDSAIDNGGSGLAGIERRLQMFGGSFQIESRPGQGTVATLLIPLGPTAGAAGGDSAGYPQNTGDSLLKILIADDHAMVRGGLRQFLVNAGVCSIAGEAASGKEALAQVDAEPWDLLLLDIGLPDVNGIEVLKRVKRSHPGLPVLVFSMYAEDDYAMAALEAGAAGYLPKNSAPENILDAIRQVGRGARYLSPQLGEKLLAGVASPGKKQPHDLLSEREFAVMIMLSRGAALTEIGEALHLSPKTISTYRARVLEKMQMSSNAELMRYVIDRKLV